MNNTSKLRVLIVDDQTMFRELLERLISQESRFEIAGSAGDGREALQRFSDLKPDLVILDLMLPGLNGADLLRQFLREKPDVRILVISGHPSEETVRGVLKAGAHGFIEKNAPVELLRQSVNQVADGGSYFGPSVATLLRNAVANPTADEGMLSSREREILQLVAEGHSTKEISVILSLSIKTVDNHRSNIMKKLNIHDIASLTRYAIKVGLITV
jgi:DNA-binding NarL/FixJ family response regulator